MQDGRARAASGLDEFGPMRDGRNSLHSKSSTSDIPVCTENLYPHIMVMKAAKDGVRFDASSPLNRGRNRRIFVQRPVRSDVIVIASIGSQDPAQMRLAQDDDMVHTLAPDRPDQQSHSAKARPVP